MCDVRAEVYRAEGHWRLRITGPRETVNDILADVQDTPWRIANVGGEYPLRQVTAMFVPREEHGGERGRRRRMTEKSARKVYCAQCRWHWRIWDMGPTREDCKHPSQHTVLRWANYRHHWTEDRWGSPMELNKNNDCRLFEKRKWWHFLEALVRRG